MISPPSCISREVEFIQKEDAERKRLEEAEKAHLAEIQGLQVRVNQMLLSLLCHLHPSLHTSVWVGSFIRVAKMRHIDLQRK